MNKQATEIEASAENLASEYSIAAGEIIIGTLVTIDNNGQAMVDFAQNPKACAIQAISTTSVTHQQVSRQVALLFNQGDLTQPIIMGLIHSPLQAMLENFAEQMETEKVELAGDLNIDDVKVEGNKVTFEAQEEMVFKCGEASITLTKAGKILIRGKYLLNRSSGVNRIMGGSVQVN
ncbi:DUF6484 domain-containing protein [Psychromonas sp. Urea-02u-13]|uniref:DUF6484 domain-containing protein n=1 Tax=Psychromonas sp. Urea-02u-13 TaxID=2058326 RepID=UPI000C332427|nr:DUF6484 domain-containing protein [Psychromonas sp. Urea-02u-13]PKG37370.1 hypothetical protein CXF74_19195 [Psychromonas sp. Urea-02u-13]